MVQQRGRAKSSGRKQRTHYHPSFQLPRFSSYVLHTVLRKRNKRQSHSGDNGSCEHLHNDGYLCQSYGGKEKTSIGRVVQEPKNLLTLQFNIFKGVSDAVLQDKN